MSKEIQIENLKAQMRGEKLNAYQKGLALDEYYKLLKYIEQVKAFKQKLIKKLKEEAVENVNFVKVIRLETAIQLIKETI